MNLRRSNIFSSVVRFSIALVLLIPCITSAETFIYIEEKPVLWIYPQDPVYQAWYKHVDLIKLAQQMQQGGKQQLTVFTKTALEQMAHLYEQEVMKSSQESSAGAGENFKKSRWRRAALEYTQQLHTVAQLINETSEIALYIEEYGEPTMVIDGKPYILTSPDLKKSGLLYTAIVEQLCIKGICIQEGEIKQAETDKTKIVINAEWKISETEAPIYFSEDGLQFVFSDLKNRKKKQTVCLHIMKELRLIADSLMDISSKGVAIDWHKLSLERVSGSYGYKIIINNFGDSLAMELVYLGRSGTILVDAIPWMQARMKQQVIEYKFNQADDLL